MRANATDKLMKTSIPFILFLSCAVLSGAPNAIRISPHARMTGVPVQDVKWTEGFWAEKFDLCRREIIPAVQRGLLDPKNSEVLQNLKIAAGLAEGQYHGTDWSD